MANRFPLVVDSVNLNIKELPSGDNLDLTGSDALFGDNDKAVFGVGSDLQIYHDGADSVINDNGTGSLKLQTGASTKLEVTSTGIDVTGTIEFDGLSGTGSVSVTDILDEDTMLSNSATALATQQSIKAYVDATVGATNEVVEDTTPQLGGNLDTNGNDINFGDNDKAIFGAGSDLQIYHDGTHSYIEDAAGTGNLKLRTNTLRIENAAGTELSALFVQDGAATLYNDNTARLATTSTGIDVTGNITVGGTVDGRDVATDGSKLDGIEASADVTDTANVTAAGALMDSELTSEASVKALDQGVATTDSPTFAGLTTTANVSFGDNDKIQMGAGPDLEIYHDGTSTNYISSATSNIEVKVNGGGNFKVGDEFGNHLLIVNDNGDVQLKHGSTPALKLATTSTGIDVTGTVTASTSMLVGDGEAYGFGDNSYRIEGKDDGANARIGFVTGSSEAMRIDSSGNIGIGTSSPSSPLEVAGGSAYPTTKLSRDGGTAATQGYLTTGFSAIGYSGGTGADSYLVSEHGFGFAVNAGTTALTITDGGNVGIGTSSPNRVLHVEGTASTFGDTRSVVQISDDTAMAAGVGGGILFTGKAITGQGDSNTTFAAIHGEKENGTSTNTAGAMVFSTRTSGSNPAERMRIDSSGNLLVGTTTTTAGNEGMVYFNGSSLRVTRDSDEPLNLDRLTTDGIIAAFKKDGSTVGSIGVINSDNLRIGGSVADHAGLQFALHEIVPMEANVDSNGTISLGSVNSRFKNLYLSNAVHATHINLEDAGGTYRTALDYDASSNLKVSTGASAGSRAITFFTENAEQMRLDASGNLLVGQTSASSGTVGTSLRSDGRSFFCADGNYSAHFNRNTSDGAIVHFAKDDNIVGSIGTTGGLLYLTGASSGLKISSGNIRPVNGSGANLDNSVDLGKSDTRYKDLYLSGGVYLGGTGSANHLDDYEEGTWTPAYTTTNSDATVAYQTQRGRYVKIGDFVSITWYVEFGTVTSAGSGSVKITGVPFQAQSNNDSRGTDTYYNVDYDSSNYLPPISYLPSSATSALQFLQTRDAGSWVVASTSTMTISTNDIISGSMVFRAA